MIAMRQLFAARRPDPRNASAMITYRRAGTRPVAGAL
jgi:hypothetical protein